MPSFGIDLGTTNSLIGSWDDNGFQLYQSNERMNATPSAVYFRSAKQVFVGRRALDFLERDPANGRTEFKRNMGKPDADFFPQAEGSLTAVDLSAKVLASLAKDAYRMQEVSVESAVITVPAAFGVVQCQATVEAARLAGIEKTTLLQEPIAAAIAYGVLPKTNGQNWLVFDLGGGTFDAAVVSTKDHHLTVLSHAGERYLGGKDIDRALVNRVIWPKLAESYTLPSRNSEAGNSLFMRLLRKAEDAKINLTHAASHICDVFDFGEDETGTPIELDIAITQTQLQECVDEVTDSCIALSRQAIDEARLTTDDVEKILVVGGSTQIPRLRRRLESELGIELDTTQDPITAVVRGAAYYAATNHDLPVEEPAADESSRPEIFTHVTVDPEASIALVEGRVEAPPDITEARLVSQDGEWHCDWCLLTDNLFSIRVPVNPKVPFRTYFVELRTSTGKTVYPSGHRVRIEGAISIGASTLQHSLWLEVVTAGEVRFDLLFRKGATLPQTRDGLQYKVSRTVQADSEESFLPIKIWEGEEPRLDRLSFVGFMKLQHHSRGPLVKDEPLELSASVDESRIIHLSVVFKERSRGVYESVVIVPDQTAGKQRAVHLRERIEQDYITVGRLLDDLGTVGEAAGSSGERLRALRRRLETIDIELFQSADDGDEVDRLSGKQVEIRRVLDEEEQFAESNLAEDSIKTTGQATLSSLEARIQSLQRALARIETDAEDDQHRMQAKRVGQAITKDPDRVSQREMEDHLDQAERFVARVRAQDMDFWPPYLNYLRSVRWSMANQDAAEAMLDKADEAFEHGDVRRVHELVYDLYSLLPESQERNRQIKDLKAGLASY